MCDMSSDKPIYIYEMKYSKRYELNQILDVNEGWKRLAESLGKTALEVAKLDLEYRRPGGSPTDMLLTNWGHSNATVEMLVSHLLRAGLRFAAEKLRGLVPASAFDSGGGAANKHKFGDSAANAVGHVHLDAADLPMPNLDDLPVKSVVYKLAACNNELNKPSNIGSGAGIPNIVDQPSSGSQAQRDYTWTDNSRTYRTPTSTYQHVEKSSPSVFSPPRINPSEWSTLVQSGRHLEAVESEDSDMVTSPPVNKASVKPAKVEPSIMAYNFEEIKTATGNFSEENMIGCGGFGDVYMANIRQTPVAIKRLHENKKDHRDFLAEINSLIRFRHKNIITLYGSSTDGPRVCLVYEFMVNGSLQDRLTRRNDSPVLKWTDRQRILKDVASGLQYFEAKISDFGLAKVATGRSEGTGKFTNVTRDEMTDVYGSRAYLPQDFVSNGCKYSISTDVFSFGVVVYETCTGLKAYDSKRKNEERLVDRINCRADDCKLLCLRDPLTPKWPDSLWLCLMEIGQKCTSQLKKHRPAMSVVQSMLEKLVMESQLLTCGEELQTLKVDDVAPEDVDDCREKSVEEMKCLNDKKQSSECSVIDSSVSDCAAEAGECTESGDAALEVSDSELILQKQKKRCFWDDTVCGDVSTSTAPGQSTQAPLGPPATDDNSFLQAVKSFRLPPEQRNRPVVGPPSLDQDTLRRMEQLVPESLPREDVERVARLEQLKQLSCRQ